MINKRKQRPSKTRLVNLLGLRWFDGLGLADDHRVPRTCLWLLDRQGKCIRSGFNLGVIGLQPAICSPTLRNTYIQSIKVLHTYMRIYTYQRDDIQMHTNTQVCWNNIKTISN